MSDEDAATIGKLMKERQDALRRLTCAKQTARAMGSKLGEAGCLLQEAATGQDPRRVIGDYPDKETANAILEEITREQDKIREKTEMLAQMGIQV